MGSSPDAASPPDEIRIRTTAWQRTTPLLPLAVLTAVLYLTPGTEFRPPGGLPAVAAFWIALLVLGTLVPSRLGITLTRSAIVVHTFRRRTIPWSDIQDMKIETTLGSRTVVLHETNGRRTELGVPTTGFLVRDSRFEEKFRTIEACWTTHRGPDWTPASQSLAWSPPAP
ncbi:hypothetical protein ACIPN8_38535 [Streptomyces sp. NPDC086082]|uniref:hypothetical protein n=1 Tax=Streptomyces sp. NPDC086082 TaxID=3365750 RepID=UPI0038178835